MASHEEAVRALVVLLLTSCVAASGYDPNAKPTTPVPSDEPDTEPLPPTPKAARKKVGDPRVYLDGGHDS